MLGPREHTPCIKHRFPEYWQVEHSGDYIPILTGAISGKWKWEGWVLSVLYTFNFMIFIYSKKGCIKRNNF